MGESVSYLLFQYSFISYRCLAALSLMSSRQPSYPQPDASLVCIPLIALLLSTHPPFIVKIVRKYELTSSQVCLFPFSYLFLQSTLMSLCPWSARLPSTGRRKALELSVQEKATRYRGSFFDSHPSVRSDPLLLSSVPTFSKVSFVSFPSFPLLISSFRGPNHARNISSLHRQALLFF